DRLPLGRRERPGAAPRIHARAVQDLARVDVADAGDLLLVEEEALDAEFEVLGSCCERLAGWGARDRIGPESGDRAVAREPAFGHETQEAEAARVLEAEPGAVGEGDARMHVRERLIALALGEE